MNAILHNHVLHGLYALFILFVFSIPALAQQEESLTYDPQTGKYIMYYYSDETQKLERVVFELPNKIVPTIRSKVKETDKGTITYHYKVKNGKESKQNFRGMRLLASHAYGALSLTKLAFEPGQFTPKGWRGSVIPNVKTSEFTVAWSYDIKKEERGTGAGLKPSQSQSGFGYESRDLPGVGVIEAWGVVVSSPDDGDFPDEGPGPDTEVGKRYRELYDTSEHVRRLAAIPRIVVPDPFNAAVVLAGIQKHMNEDLVKMKLIDPAFATSLDRLFQTAVAAVQQGNTTALRSHLKEIRQALKKEHMDVEKEDDDFDDKEDEKKGKKEDKRLIDKLAAKVLDFDLKYVLKRVGEKD